MADGNFKADHVRQKNQVDDVWLSEGSGMIAKREDYYTFLATAIERLTVSIILFYNVWPAGMCVPGLHYGVMTGSSLFYLPISWAFLCDRDDRHPAQAQDSWPVITFFIRLSLGFFYALVSHRKTPRERRRKK